MRIAVVLFNLGGPDSLPAVEPFLRNLFGDPAIIGLPGFVRRPLARLIAKRRAPIAREIYAHMGGKSPIAEETEAQARALETALRAAGHDAKCAIAMRYWHPLTADAVDAVGHDHVKVNKKLAATDYSGVCHFINDKNNVLGQSVTVYHYTSPTDKTKVLDQHYDLDFVPNDELGVGTTAAPAAAPTTTVAR